MKVWDGLVRLLHWTLVASIAVAWWTREQTGNSHQQAGYVALSVVAVRLVWGFTGSRFARFAQFVRSPRSTLTYLVQITQKREPRHVGHNPLGGWMVLAMMLCIFTLACTGWLSTTDRFWGYEWLQNLHATLAWTLVAQIVAHVAGVVFTSLRHQENLILAMLSGRKRAPEDSDVS